MRTFIVIACINAVLFGAILLFDLPDNSLEAIKVPPAGYVITTNGKLFNWRHPVHGEGFIMVSTKETAIWSAWINFEKRRAKWRDL